jgi:hypothetical protein
MHSSLQQMGLSEYPRVSNVGSSYSPSLIVAQESQKGNSLECKQNLLVFRALSDCATNSFDKFHRVENATGRSIEGTGIINWYLFRCFTQKSRHWFVF